MALDGGARPLTHGLSSASWGRIVFLEDPVCDGCGVGFEFEQGPGALCAACMTSRHAFARARAACVYDEHSRDLILKLKHADRTDLAPLLARWLSRAAAPLLIECDAVAPVPLHWRRLIARRYNQAAELARPLARHAGRRYLPAALVRRRATGTQGGKSGRGRRENVRAAFAVPRASIKHVEGRRILLVDDVLTTGATLDACAKTLLAAGASAVDVAVVARVQAAAQLAI